PGHEPSALHVSLRRLDHRRPGISPASARASQRRLGRPRAAERVYSRHLLHLPRHPVPCRVVVPDRSSVSTTELRTMETPSVQQVVEQVAALLQRRRTSQARALLQPALAAHPQHAGLLLQAAYVDYLDDRIDDAMRTVRQVLAADPDHP